MRSSVKLLRWFMGNSYIRNFDILLYNMMYALHFVSAPSYLNLCLELGKYPCITYVSYVLNYTGGFIKATALEYRGGIFLEAIGTKILRLLHNAFRCHLHQRIFLLRYGFLGLEIFAATVEKGERS
jgi:hypothetical protein